MRRKDNIHQPKGFTLIELIVSLAILAIVGAVAGMGFLSMMQGYLIVKANAATSQQAQIVLERLSKELGNTAKMIVGDATSVTFETPASPGQEILLSWNSTTKELSLGPVGSGDVLAKQVSAYQIKYHDTYEDAGGDVYLPASTTMIQMTLGLSGADDTVSAFETRILLAKIVAGI